MNEHQMVNKERITFWAYSPGLLKIADQFEKENPDVRVVKKLLKNSTILLEELYAAQSAGNSPDIAEIPSWYGIAPLIESDAILPMDEYLTTEFQVAMPKSIAKRFLLDDVLWAIPLNYEIPILYANDAILSHDQVSLENINSFSKLLEMGEKLEHPNVKWAINADNLYPWYIENLNEGSEKTVASLIDEYEEILFHMNHMALTQFVNGEGAVLLSSSGKMQLIEKLIGSRFKWSMRLFPVAPENIIPNGNGIVILKNEKVPSDYTRQFLRYIQEEDQLKTLAMEQSLIPANMRLIKNEKFHNFYRHFPGYQKMLIESLKAEGQFLRKDDEVEWKMILHANENKE